MKRRSGTRKSGLRQVFAVLLLAMSVSAWVLIFWKGWVLLRVRDAASAFEGMKARKVLVKNVSTMHPLLHNCLRLTVGNAQDNATNALDVRLAKVETTKPEIVVQLPKVSAKRNIKLVREKGELVGATVEEVA